MRRSSLMFAALLLLLCIACNEKNGADFGSSKVDLKKIKQEEGHFAVDTTKVGKNEYQQPGGTGEPNTNADWERKL